MAIAKKKVPDTLGEMIDAAYRVREARDGRKKELEQDPKLAALNEEYAALESAILSKLQEEHTTLARGSTARASVNPERAASIDLENGGWPVLWKWAKKADAFDIFYKRLASNAVCDRLDRGEKLPAVKVAITNKLSLRVLSKSE